jgi:hypothetical protein
MDIRVRVELSLCLDSLQAEVLGNLLSPSLVATAATQHVREHGSELTTHGERLGSCKGEHGGLRHCA